METNLQNQIQSVDKINTYILDWNKYYNQQDFNNMDKVYKKMEEELKNVMPLESTINDARQVENLHNLIKNNGKNFNLSQYEIDLANKLA